MKWLVLLSLVLANLVRTPSPIVRVGSGLVRGLVSDDGKIHQYLGVPYATVDKSNRFQAPLPPPKWEGILEAIDENVRCPQKMIGPIIFGEENCLKLNIHTPVTKENLLPVMVYIHGGGFIEGTGSSFLYGPDFIVEQDVVFVGINYRLNVEGFLCLGIKEAPGNAGLKDQIAALKWVQENIVAFGGDPNNVTLFGESAGAVSISYLIMSPEAKGLFHRAILQSGATLAPWAIQHDPIKTARKLSRKFGYGGKDPYKIYKTLSKQSVNDLLEAIKYTKVKNLITSDILFVPCVEKSIPGVTPAVPEYPVNAIKSGNYFKIPMIIGNTDLEGIYFVGSTYGNSLKNMEEQVNPFDLFFDDLQYPSKEIQNATMSDILQYYFPSNKSDLIMELVDFFSDLHIKYPIAVESSLYSKTTDQPIYYYVFKYGGFLNMAKFISGFFIKEGASHADDLLYLFKPSSFPLPMRYFEMDMMKRMVSLWTNFAKHGDPTPKTTKLLPIRWKPSRSSNPTALVIDKSLSSAPMWKEETIALWNKTYTKYRRKRYGFH